MLRVVALWSGTGILLTCLTVPPVALGSVDRPGRASASAAAGGPGATAGPGAATADQPLVETVAEPTLDPTTDPAPTADPTPAPDPNVVAAPGAEPVRVRYGGDPAQYYLAWIPPRPTTRAAVAVVHGGFWISGDPEATAGFNRRLYAAGVPSFSIGYRLAQAAAWPAPRTDLTAALSAIRARAADYRIGARRVALVGSSAGGHLALAVGSRSGRKATCAVITYSAPTSIPLVRAEGADDYRRELLAAASLQLAPTDRLARSATLPASPGRTDTPALLFAAQQEWLSSQHASRYVRAYRGTRLDVRRVILAGLDEHAMRYALNIPTVWRQTLAFVTRHC